MHALALTITTDQIQGWGLVGCVILVLITLLVIRLVRSVVGRVVWTIVAVLLLLLVWAQRSSVESSIKACDPKVLGVHLVISDPAARAECVRTLGGNV